MPEFVTLVFKCETEKDYDAVRALAGTKQCRAWSRDHEILRNDLMKQAAEEGNVEKVIEYWGATDIWSFRDDLQTT